MSSDIMPSKREPTIYIRKSEMAAFKKSMSKVTSFMGSEVMKIMSKAGLEARNEAIINAPIGTPKSTGIKGYQGGNLRASMFYEPIDRGFGAQVTSKRSFKGKEVEYAKYVNDGWTSSKGNRYKGHFFMQKALKAGLKKFNDEFDKLKLSN